jgi:hypothetical protein
MNKLWYGGGGAVLVMLLRRDATLMARDKLTRAYFLKNNQLNRRLIIFKKRFLLDSS